MLLRKPRPENECGQCKRYARTDSSHLFDPSAHVAINQIAEKTFGRYEFHAHLTSPTRNVEQGLYFFVVYQMNMGGRFNLIGTHAAETVRMAAENALRLFHYPTLVEVNLHDL